MRIGVLVILCGTVLGCFTYSEADITYRASEVPAEITLQQLIANGPDGNSNIVLTDFVPCENYVFLQSKESGLWMHVWIPLVPLQDLPRRDNERLNVTAPKVLLASDTIRNPLDLKAKLGQRQIRARIANGIAARDSMAQAKDVIQQAYPGIDLSSCLILEEGRIPLSRNTILLMGAMSALCLIVGSAVIVVDFWQ